MVLAAAGNIDIHGRLGWDGADDLDECLGVMDVRAVQPHTEIVGFDPSLSRRAVFHHRVEPELAWAYHDRCCWLSYGY